MTKEGLLEFKPFVLQKRKSVEKLKTCGRHPSCHIYFAKLYKSFTRCGCPFKISFSFLDLKAKDDMSVRLNGSSNFKHGNRCCPSRAQLVVQKRKAGAYTKAINEKQIKCILLLLSTNNKVASKTMRDLLRPLFPPGHCLDAKFLFNFRLRARKILHTKPGAVSDMTINLRDESQLLNVDSLDFQLPQYFTEAFRQFHYLVHDALKDTNDINQIENYPNLLSRSDCSFKWRRASDSQGRPTGYMWQTGVMRKYLEGCGSTLFVDRPGRPRSNKGWPLFTMAMLSGAKKVCVTCDAIMISERGDAYAWLIQACVDLTPGFELSNIKVIYADGINAGEIAVTCQ
jgi:hypothetical protein